MITLLNGETYLQEEIVGMAYDDDFYLSRMIMAGAKGYLIKPFTEKALIEAIHATVKGD